MTVQFAIVLALAVACVLYFLKDFLRSAATGGCGSGCGSCASGGCPARKLQGPGTGLTEPPKPRR